ncbi:BnaC05g19820D [Brassica napus]|uniref:BnaC05g19820D protein n=2 Tax=Brassica napus TaxID=3708 RepID=A0A078FJX6_BRANA|nr:BnaC05g19820D [Brassica napus]
MSDVSLVAEALISFHHVEPPPHPEKSGVTDLKLKWSVRQRRSKATGPSRKKGEHTRASPSTPLSWSDATSLSGGGAGGGSGVAAFEESSCTVKLSEAVRSKVRLVYTSLLSLSLSL